MVDQFAIFLLGYPEGARVGRANERKTDQYAQESPIGYLSATGAAKRRYATVVSYSFLGRNWRQYRHDATTDHERDSSEVGRTHRLGGRDFLSFHRFVMFFHVYPSYE